MNARNAALATICSAEEEGLNDIDKELEEAVEKEMGVLPLPKHRRRTKSFRSPKPKDDENNEKKEEPVANSKVTQDGWTVEVRKRKSGKLQGGVYKVFIDPKGVKFYSKTKAELAGMAKSSSPKAHLKPKAKGRDKKKQKQA
ncbi:unnamed protein product [Durusdinium trenchii]|uniref:MBD domain-containing protein n=1 Tax=Durusdinium trenchii TaxID=1381693 RepID=A0ABP0MPN2_9DINO